MIMVEPGDDARLVSRTLNGDQRAFTALVERYTGAVYNQAYRMLNNAQDAEDAVQEIFLRAYRRLDTYDPTRRLVTWLLTIGSNYCIDRLRRRRYQWLTLDDVAFWLPATETGPERNALEGERRAEVQRALQTLPLAYRDITVLRYWHDFSYLEIAEATGLTESAVKTRLHRARKMLSEALGADGEAMVWEAETTTN
jgi:RNA polymerase sigma-70 factor, ECF subfamily